MPIIQQWSFKMRQQVKCLISNRIQALNQIILCLKSYCLFTCIFSSLTSFENLYSMGSEPFPPGLFGAQTVHCCPGFPIRIFSSPVYSLPEIINLHQELECCYFSASRAKPAPTLQQQSAMEIKKKKAQWVHMKCLGEKTLKNMSGKRVL